MREWIYECWISIMDADYNPLRHIPDMQVRHMILQVLAWMWCIICLLYTSPSPRDRTRSRMPSSA